MIKFKKEVKGMKKLITEQLLMLACESYQLLALPGLSRGGCGQMSCGSTAVSAY